MRTNITGTVVGTRTVDGKKFSLATGPLVKSEVGYQVRLFRHAYFYRTVKIGSYWYVYTRHKQGG